MLIGICKTCVTYIKRDSEGCSFIRHVLCTFRMRSVVTRLVGSSTKLNIRKSDHCRQFPLPRKMLGQVYICLIGLHYGSACWRKEYLRSMCRYSSSCTVIPQDWCPAFTTLCRLKWCTPRLSYFPIFQFCIIWLEILRYCWGPRPLAHILYNLSVELLLFKHNLKTSEKGQNIYRENTKITLFVGFIRIFGSYSSSFCKFLFLLSIMLAFKSA